MVIIHKHSCNKAKMMTVEENRRIGKTIVPLALLVSLVLLPILQTRAVDWNSIPVGNSNPDFKYNLNGWHFYPPSRTGNTYYSWSPQGTGGRQGSLVMIPTTGSWKAESWQNSGRFSPGDVVLMKFRARVGEKLNEGYYHENHAVVSGVKIGWDFRKDDFTLVHEEGTKVLTSTSWTEMTKVFTIPTKGTIWDSSRKRWVHPTFPNNTRGVFHISTWPKGARTFVQVDYAYFKVYTR